MEVTTEKKEDEEGEEEGEEEDEEEWIEGDSEEVVVVVVVEGVTQGRTACKDERSSISGVDWTRLSWLPCTDGFRIILCYYLVLMWERSENKGLRWGSRG